MVLLLPVIIGTGNHIARVAARGYECGVGLPNALFGIAKKHRTPLIVFSELLRNIEIDGRKNKKFGESYNVRMILMLSFGMLMRYTGIDLSWIYSKASGICTSDDNHLL